MKKGYQGDERVLELERIASQYHLNKDVPDKFIEDICQHHCCDWLSNIVTQNDDVIELGYGEGVTVSRLAKLAKSYTVVEGAQSLVDVMKRLHPNVRVENALFETHMPTRKCDKLLALHVLEHVDNPVSLARHLRSWLNADGEIVVVVPNRNSLHRQLAVLMGLQPQLDTLSNRDKLVGHQRVYDLSGLVSDLEAAGFATFETKGLFTKVLPNSMMLTYEPSLIRALNALGDRLPAELGANLLVRARIKR